MLESDTYLQVSNRREVLAATREVTDGFVLLLVDILDVRLDISPLLEQLSAHSACKWLLVRVTALVCLPGNVRCLFCGFRPRLLFRSRRQQDHLPGGFRPVKPIYRKCHIAIDSQLVSKCAWDADGGCLAHVCFDSSVSVHVGFIGSLLSEAPIAACKIALVFFQRRLGLRFLAIS